MNENEANWHHKTWVRVVVLLLVPFVIGGLYLITIRFSLDRPASEPAELEQ